MTEPTKTECDVSPFKSDAEREAFWKEHLAKNQRTCEHAVRALQPWRDYLCESVREKQVWRLEHAVRSIIEAADFRAEHPDLPVRISITRSAPYRWGGGRRLYATIDVGDPGNHNFATGWVHIGVRGGMGGHYYSGQLGISRDI